MGAGCFRSSASLSPGIDEAESSGCVARPRGGADNKHGSSHRKRNGKNKDQCAFDFILPLERDEAHPGNSGKGGRKGAARRRGASPSLSGIAPSSVFEQLYGRYLPFVVRHRFLDALTTPQPGMFDPTIAAAPSVALAASASASSSSSSSSSSASVSAASVSVASATDPASAVSVSAASATASASASAASASSSSLPSGSSFDASLGGGHASPCQPLSAPELECFEACLAFVDVSGFTGLSEALIHEHGAHGAEILNEIISQYFRGLIDVIVDFGGDVLKFAGDAMLVMWRNKKLEKRISIQPSTEAATARGANGAAVPPSPSSSKSGEVAVAIVAAADAAAAAASAAGAASASSSLSASSSAAGATGSTVPAASSPSSAAAAPSGAAPAVSPGRRASTPQVNKNVAAFMGRDGSDSEPLSALVLRAIACNMTLLALHNNYQPTPAHTLHLHTGLASGVVCGIFTGGVDGCWEYFIAGQPIQHMAAACDAAKSGQLVIHGESVPLVQNYCRLRRCAAPAPGVLSNCFEVTALLDAPRLFKSVPPSIPSSAALTRALEGFVPALVKQRLERDWVSGGFGPHAAPGATSLWLAEFRQRVFVMFVALPALAYSANLEANRATLSVLQCFVVAVQEVVSKWEGTIARLLADDKGTRFKIAFGMPSLTHEDDAVRVVSASLEIEQRIKKIASTHPLASKALLHGDAATSCAIGIAAGTVYCGEAGSGVRCEYTAVGFIVILAARLMTHARLQGGGILVDEVTRLAAAHALVFEARPKVQLKGVAHPLPVFRPHNQSGVAEGKGAKRLGLDGGGATSAGAGASGSGTAGAGASSSAGSSASTEQRGASLTLSGRRVDRPSVGSLNDRSDASSSSSSSSHPAPGAVLIPATTRLASTKNLHSLQHHIKPGPGVHPLLRQIPEEEQIEQHWIIHFPKVDPWNQPHAREASAKGSNGAATPSSPASPSKRNRSAPRRSITYASPRMPGLGSSRSSPTSPPLSSSAASSPAADEQDEATNLIGRAAEKRFLLGLLHRVSHTAESHVVLIESEAGLGKSSLVYEVLQSVESRGIDFFFGAAADQQKRTPYFAWRSIFEQMLDGLEALGSNPTLRRHHLEAVLRDRREEHAAHNPQRQQQHKAEELLRWAVLLNALLGTNFAENEHTRSLNAEQRAKLMQQLLVDILGEMAETDAEAAADTKTREPQQQANDFASITPLDLSAAAVVAPVCKPRVLVLEELHWFDTASWELLLAVCAQLPNLLILLTSRPMTTQVPQLARLEKMRGVTIAAPAVTPAAVEPAPAMEPTDGTNAVAADAVNGSSSTAASESSLVAVSSAVRSEACFHRLMLREFDQNESLNFAWVLFGGRLDPALHASRNGHRNGTKNATTTPAAIAEEGDENEDEETATAWPSSTVVFAPSPPSVLSSSVSMPAALQSLLYETSRGNPLFVEELCRSLVEEGVVKVHLAGALGVNAPFSISYEPEAANAAANVQAQSTQGEKAGPTKGRGSQSTAMAPGLSLTLSPPGSGSLLPLSGLSSSKSVLQLMMSRVDRLPPSEQMTLKVCSVIGLEIQLEQVRRIHPMHRAKGGNNKTIQTTPVVAPAAAAAATSSTATAPNADSTPAAGPAAASSDSPTKPASSTSHASALLQRDFDNLVAAGFLFKTNVEANSPTDAATPPAAASAAETSTPVTAAAVSVGVDPVAPVYAFRNAIFREAAYNMLGLIQRTTLHEQCAADLQEMRAAAVAATAAAGSPTSSSASAASPSAAAPAASASDPVTDLDPSASLIDYHLRMAAIYKDRCRVHGAVTSPRASIGSDSHAAKLAAGEL